MLVHKKVTVNVNKQKHIAYTLCSFILYMLMKSARFPTAIVLLLFMSCQIIYIRLISSASFAESLFWSTAYLSLVMIADEITYFAFSVMEYGHLADVENLGQTRLTAMLIYYPFLLIGTFFLSKISPRRFNIPLRVTILSYLTVFLGILFFYMQIDMVAELSKSTQAMPQMVASSFASCVLLIIFFLFLLVLIVISGRYYSENQQLILRETELEYEAKQYKTYADTFHILRGWKHDYRNQLLTLSDLAKKGNLESVRQYLEELLAPSSEMLSATTGNIILDALINTKQSFAKEEGISIISTVYLPETTSLSQVELSSLIGNLVDNAIEACQHLDDPSSKTINLCIKPSRGNLLISISNPTDGRYLTDSEGRLLSTKNESGHGIGLERVRSIVEGHNGYLQILPSAELFNVRIVLPLASAQDDQNQNME